MKFEFKQERKLAKLCNYVNTKYLYFIMPDFPIRRNTKYIKFMCTLYTIFDHCSAGAAVCTHSTFVKYVYRLSRKTGNTASFFTFYLFILGDVGEHLINDCVFKLLPFCPFFKLDTCPLWVNWPFSGLWKPDTWCSKKTKNLSLFFENIFGWFWTCYS